MLETIIFYLLLIDSIGANAVAWLDGSWYSRHFRIFSRWFPAARGWTTYYLVLVLLLGWLLQRNGVNLL